ncbi:lysine N(6)-hydroxylase/L-ornithine N(5)-oxygenase family protein [Streptomyces sp. URMC 123]|uniref:lysine N(6)-hydroxylase/L-ornithine N(5)-oxygenase family protein n=1 Tax=Streptomyces sp. URMC 123 TaxID=3423403 RepID=UPI003F1AB0E4
MPTARNTEVLDVVGIGFGPSNLALAVALAEHNRNVPAEDALTSCHFEKQPSFGWHRGMLLDDATMQVSFMKDLVTMRDPTSEFSFLAYLHHKGRLADFINHKVLYPSRVEFHDYLEWAARSFEPLVHYGHEVIDVRPVELDGEIAYFDVVARSGAGPDEVVVRRTRNIVLAGGLQPNLPPGAQLTERVWHNHDLLGRLERLPAGSPGSFTVVGAGQSAAETVEYLHRRYPTATVNAVFARYGYAPADDSSFVNRIFDPDAVDRFFQAPEDIKRMMLDYHRGTNYSVVDLELIDELYRRVYQEKVHGEERLRVHNLSRVLEVRPSDASVRLTLESLPTGERSFLDTDYLVYATGYRPLDVLHTLGATAPYCRTDEGDRVRVERDYRVATDESVAAGIYLQGATEHTHGIASNLLSNTAVRAGEIVRSLAATVPKPDHDGYSPRDGRAVPTGRA